MINKNGFTLVELVITIMIMGIIVVVGASRFTDSATFSNRANADKVKFMLKTAQKAAMAQRRDIYIDKSGSQISLCYTNVTPCPTSQMLTLNKEPFIINIQNTPVTIPTIKFNSKGNAGSSKLIIQVGTKNIEIEAESGYIHE